MQKDEINRRVLRSQIPIFGQKSWSLVFGQGIILFLVGPVRHIRQQIEPLPCRTCESYQATFKHPWQYHWAFRNPLCRRSSHQFSILPDLSPYPPYRSSSVS
ncbi:hypothetical protein YC2023_072023 [Brassica napus]